MISYFEDILRPSGNTVYNMERPLRYVGVLGVKWQLVCLYIRWHLYLSLQPIFLKAVPYTLSASQYQYVPEYYVAPPPSKTTYTGGEYHTHTITGQTDNQ